MPFDEEKITAELITKASAFDRHLFRHIFFLIYKIPFNYDFLTVNTHTHDAGTALCVPRAPGPDILLCGDAGGGRVLPARLVHPHWLRGRETRPPPLRPAGRILM